MTSPTRRRCPPAWLSHPRHSATEFFHGWRITLPLHNGQFHRDSKIPRCPFRRHQKGKSPGSLQLDRDAEIFLYFTQKKQKSFRSANRRQLSRSRRSQTRQGRLQFVGLEQARTGRSQHSGTSNLQLISHQQKLTVQFPRLN